MYFQHAYLGTRRNFRFAKIGAYIGPAAGPGWQLVILARRTSGTAHTRAKCFKAPRSNLLENNSFPNFFRKARPRRQATSGPPSAGRRKLLHLIVFIRWISIVTNFMAQNSPIWLFLSDEFALWPNLWRKTAFRRKLFHLIVLIGWIRLN